MQFVWQNTICYNYKSWKFRAGQIVNPYLSFYYYSFHWATEYLNKWRRFLTRDICSSRTNRGSRCSVGAVLGPEVGPQYEPPAFFSSPLHSHCGASCWECMQEINIVKHHSNPSQANRQKWENYCVALLAPQLHVTVHHRGENNDVCFRER